MSTPDLPDTVDEADLPALLPRVLDRSEHGGVTVITRQGQPIAAMVSLDDLQVAEDAVDVRFAAKDYPDTPDRVSLDDILADMDQEQERR